jgi:Flp pilus assembly protein TadG
MSKLHPPKRRTSPRGDAGVVTVETVMVLPVLFLLLSLMIATLAVVHAKMSAVDASREAARLAARGESAAAVAAGQRLGPQHATVELRDRSHWVQAVVTAKVRLFGTLPPLTVSASTLAEREEP